MLFPENPNASSQVFYNCEDILNFARVLVNDAQSGLTGQDLSDDRPYTWTLLNFVYGKLQNWLEDNNVESAMYAEAVVTLPASVYSADPNAQCKLDYTGFTDATGNFYDTPALPGDLLEPLQLWSRPSDVNQPFREMSQQLGGMDGTYGLYTYRKWEFRGNGVYLQGGVNNQIDLRIRYMPSLPMLIQPPTGSASPRIWFARAGEAFAYMIAAEFAEIRGAANAPMLRAKANEELQIIANKSAKRSNQANVRARGYAFGRSRGTWQ